MFYIRMFPAQNGDCFFVGMGTSPGVNLLIDAGYGRTYHRLLKPFLQTLSQSGAMLDRLIVTHIDSDHIGGALPFLAENGAASSPKIIPIKQIWHNSYRHFQFKAQENAAQYTTDKRKVDAILKAVVARGYKSPEGSAEGPVSARQGSTLGSLILKGGYSWNDDFRGMAACVEHGPCIELENGAKLIFLSPSSKKLQALDAYWRKELNKMGCFGCISESTYFDDAFEYFMSHEPDSVITRAKGAISSSDSVTIENLVASKITEDTSVNNGSSLAFVLEYQNHRVLFLGDAHPTQVTAALKSYYGEDLFPLWFDAVKVSHHGSANNLSSELLACLDSSCFLISTNGKRHHHPDREAIARIIARDTSSPRHIVCNYSTKAAKFFNKPEWKEKYRYDIFMPESDKEIAHLEVHDHGAPSISFETN